MSENKLAEPWNRTAGEYASVFDGLVTQGIEPTLNAAAVKAGQDVLDVACGPGLLAAAAADRGAQPLGVDFASNMIGVAKRRYPNIHFEIADAQELPFDDSSFDAVVMGFALFMLTDPHQALLEAYRVLRPGGRLAATVWDQPLPAFDLFYGVMPNYIDEEVLPGAPPLQGVSDHDVLTSVLDNAGFEDSAVATLPIVWDLSEAGDLVNAMATLRDFSSLSEQQMSELTAEIVQGAKQWQNGDRFHVPNPALVVSGSRP